jgi:Gnt-I system low-affinity gluconate transporter
MDYQLLLAVLGGIALLLVLIIRLKISAFIALLIACIFTGWLSGMEVTSIVKTMQNGMGSTLGYVATIVGLGAIFGGMLEKSGGAQAIAKAMLSKFGSKNAPLTMSLSGLIVAIPVFFDVAFIIFIPILNALFRQTGKSVLIFAIPLLAGLAVAHAFIPPTPGPVAVADILGADLGLVILLGILAGIPTVLLAGVWFGKFIGNKIYIKPAFENVEDPQLTLPNASTILTIIFVPIVLILLNTSISSQIIPLQEGGLKDSLLLLGHPFSALIIANLLAWYILGVKKGYSGKELMKLSTKSMQAAGAIILLTGAGGAFKQILVDSGAGEMIANQLNSIGFPVIVFAFLTAVVVRVLQGSATVAMITGAGLVAPLLSAELSDWQLASIVIAIAAGGTTLSHVNDSGFWLVHEYLGLTEKQTFASWSIMTTIVALSGFLFSLVFYTI